MNSSLFLGDIPEQSNDIGDTENLNNEYDRLAQALVIVEIIFSLLGVVTNTINIRVFVEQGVTTSSTNVGLVSLSVFDLVCCLLLIPTRLCVVFDFTEDRPQRAVCGSYMVFTAGLFVIFRYCSNWTTVYVSLERALCVLIPLKVKSILRPNVTAIVIVSIFIIFVSAQLTYSASTRIVWGVFSGIKNLTLPIVIETEFGKQYLYYYSMIGQTILSTVALLAVSTTTVIMVQKLIKFRKWRQKNTGSSEDKSASSNKKQLSTKDAELVKSVTIVTSIFLVCLSIGHIPGTIILVIPGNAFSTNKRHLVLMGYQILFLSSVINSSINFFFYIRMSSRYKTSFATTFPTLSRLISDEEG